MIVGRYHSVRQGLASLLVAQLYQDLEKEKAQAGIWDMQNETRLQRLWRFREWIQIICETCSAE